MTVFDHDHTLPALPVPDPATTCEQLRDMIRPLVTNEQFEQTCSTLEHFFSGDASELNDLLLQWKSRLPGNSSWLRPFWDDLYLTGRGRLPIHVNYCFRFDHKRWGSDALPLLMAALARVIRGLATGDLAPEETKSGPLSMDTLRSVLYTRIPGEVRDALNLTPLSGPMSAAVVCRGHWFVLMLTDEQGELCSPAALNAALQSIRSQAQLLPASDPVSALTAAERDNAAKLRGKLLQAGETNRISLECLEKALFAVCLDEPIKDEADFSRNVLCGSAENRWFDKSLQIIAEPGGMLGANFEHAGCDAGIWVCLLTLADAVITENRLKMGHDAAVAHTRLLQWKIPPPLQSELAGERDAYREFSDGTAVCMRKCTGISKQAIKPKKCSPDAFVQILFQTVYYGLTGQIRSVYEACSTRSFFQGRTECIRPVTEESAAFVTAFADRVESRERLQAMLRAALDAHSQRITTAQNAQGAERHMHGLLCMYRQNMEQFAHQPEIFEDAGYLTLRHDAMSTSSITTPFIEFFGFGPVVPDGLGLGYGVTQDSLNVSVSAFQGSGLRPESYLDLLESTGKELLTLLD